MDLPTHLCRNKVYRQGIIKRCNRPTNWLHCNNCQVALEEKRARLLGLSEAKKEPSNKPDDLDVEDSFEVHDDYDDGKKEPGKPGKQKRKSSLQDGPEGEKGSKKKPYLESFMPDMRPSISWPSKSPQQLQELRELRDRLEMIRLRSPEGDVDVAMDPGLAAAIREIDGVIRKLEGNTHDSESWAMKNRRPGL